MQFSDGFLNTRPASSLVSHLHHFTVTHCSSRKHLSLGWIMTSGLFYVHVLASLQSQKCCRSMPMIWHGDSDRIDRFIIQCSSEIGNTFHFPLRLFGKESFCSLGC